jgi:hypothetical protein
MGCLRLDATIVLYRRRDVSFKTEQSQWPNSRYTAHFNHKKKTPSSPNSSHRIAHTQSPITTRSFAQQTRMRHSRTILASRPIRV